MPHDVANRVYFRLAGLLALCLAFLLALSTPRVASGQQADAGQALAISRPAADRLPHAH